MVFFGKYASCMPYLCANILDPSLVCPKYRAQMSFE